jgi:cbb3-type cytochrome oxidase maturation protein
VESFYLLIPIALAFVALAIGLLFWAINGGQYDNLDTEAHRILFDEDVTTQKDIEPSATETQSSALIFTDADDNKRSQVSDPSHD